MHVSRSFFASLALHGVILALAWSITQMLHQPPGEPEKVAISLAAYLPEPPQSPAIPETPPPEMPAPISSKPSPVVPGVTPPQPSAPRAVSAPLPAQPLPEPVSPASALPPPAAAVAAPIKAAPPPPPPPPPPEERYEEAHLGQIRTILAERLKYPRNALRLKQQGETKITFTLSPSREVSQLVITQTSGFELLDEAARDLILSSAGEFPKPSKAVRITVPIGYKIR